MRKEKWWIFKKTYMKNVIESIEDQKHNNIRKMYQTVNQFKKGSQHKFSIITNKKENWQWIQRSEQKYGKNILTNYWTQKKQRELIKKGNKEISEVEVEVEEPFIEGVKEAIRNLKNNKAAGTDGIHPELIKYGWNKLLNRMYELVRQILEEERIPEEWKETIIVRLHKRGDRDRCENYRGTALRNAAYKILSNIILGKITPYTETLGGTIRMDLGMEDL